ncbi:MAG: TetR/AcrR family transcriptional regulator [Pseudomonadota bacterium]|nr:TetR/AcrR family transcriptional regulator [Pseudomonadota bacterium]
MGDSDLETTNAAKAPPATQTTRIKLMTAAERLFALQGIDGITNRHILVEAGQRNESALQYHFGTRDGLIESILEWRMSPINEFRNMLIDQVETEGRTLSMRDLISAIILPLCEPVRTQEGTNYYNRFLVAIEQSPERTIDGFTRGKYDSGIQRVTALMDAQLSHMSPSVRRQRFGMLAAMITFGVANIETVMSRRTKDGGTFNLDRAIENLIDMCTGAIEAPVSDSVTQLTAEPDP